MNAKEKRLMRNKLGSLRPQAPVPEGYQNWLDFLKQNKRPTHPYKSWLEFRLFEFGSLIGVPYEPEVLPYTKHINKQCKYTPDGMKGDFLFEVKGRFRTRDEAEKYIHIKKEYPFRELIFIFASPGVKFPGSKKRKDGSFFTMEDWCKKNGFRYFYECSDLSEVLDEY